MNWLWFLFLFAKASIPKIEIFYASDGDVQDDDESKSSTFEDACTVFKSIKHDKGRRFSLFKINSTTLFLTIFLSQFL